MKFLKIVVYILGLTPFVWIVPLHKFYIDATLFLGYAPHYNMPDSGTLPMYSEYDPYIDIGFSIWGYSLIAWVLLSIILLIAYRKEGIYKPILISFLFHFFGFLYLFSGVFEWYMD